MSDDVVDGAIYFVGRDVSEFIEVRSAGERVRFDQPVRGAFRVIGRYCHPPKPSGDVCGVTRLGREHQSKPIVVPAHVETAKALDKRKRKK